MLYFAILRHEFRESYPFLNSLCQSVPWFSFRRCKRGELSREALENILLTTMSKTMGLLLKLLRVALGTETDMSVPEGVDWPALVAMANAQGVAALAYGGLQKCYEADRSLVLPLDREQRQVKFDWFSAVLDVGMRCERQWKAVSELGARFNDAGLRTLVLKGFVVSGCYPEPRHRYSSDFDCFLLGPGPVTDRSAYERGNLLMEASGVKVSRFHYKHSSFKFKGVTVENHQFLTGWRGSAKWKRFELELEAMLEGKELESLSTEAPLLVGPPLFNALFLTRHAHQHFLIEDGISLRHVCDWAMFLRRYRTEFDWDEFMAICAKYGLAAFASSMTRLAGYVCGVTLDGYSTLRPEDQRLLDDILSLADRSGNDAGRVGMALRILRSGWKFRAFSDETRLGCFLRYVWGYFFVRNPKL